MSEKPLDQLNELDRLVRQTARCGMTDGTVMVIEFISGFEKFNTRPYHNYETWAQGWRVYGLNVFVEREDLDDAVKTWAEQVALKRAGEPLKRGNLLELVKRDGEPYRTPPVLPDWITPEQGHVAAHWTDGTK
jgi:hypothetical protein